MGVRFLETFITKSVPNGKEKINVLKEIENCKRQGRRPLIVFDFNGFYRAWQPDTDHFCGFRAVNHCKKLDSFFKTLKNAGGELVFFRDGSLQEAKTQKWMNHKSELYDAQFLIHRALEEKKSLAELVALKKRNNICAGHILSFLCEHSASKYGQIRSNHSVEADLALAEFATREKALAIIANDTDFLIYQGDWAYWSARDLNFDSMRTIQYNKEALRNKLGLSAEKMAYFATLAGNDIIEYDIARDFHRILGFGDSIQKVANYVGSSQGTIEDIIARVNRILRHRRGPERRNYENLVKKSVAVYDYRTLQSIEPESNRFFDRLLNSKKDFIYKILKGHIFTTKLMYEDMRSSKEGKNTLTQATIQVDIFKKWVGIAAKTYNLKTFPKCLTKISHNQPFMNIDLEPTHPKFEVPPLEKLVFRTPKDGLDDIRMKLYEWLFQNTFSAKKLLSLKLPFIPMVGAVAYLIKQHDLSVDEADVFICAYQDVFANRVPEQLDPPPKLRSRAFKLVFLVIEVMYQLSKNLNCLGLGHLEEITIFDGVWFHLLYQKWTSLGSEDKKTRLNEIKEYREFYSGA